MSPFQHWKLSLLAIISVDCHRIGGKLCPKPEAPSSYQARGCFCEYIQEQRFKMFLNAPAAVLMQLQWPDNKFTVFQILELTYCRLVLNFILSVEKFTVKRIIAAFEYFKNDILSVCNR